MSKTLLSLLVAIFIVSCQKKTKLPILNLFELTNLKNYTVTETEINDSITKVSGDNPEYFIRGNFNRNHNKREGWWKIKSKKKDEIIEIEYVILNKEKINQVKVYLNGIMVKSLSRYYVIENTNGKFRVKFYFPEHLNKKMNEPKKEKHEVTYRILDTVNNKIIRESTADLQKNKNHYYFETPKNKNENGIVGFAEKLLFEKVNDSVQLSVETVHFRD